MTCNVKKFINRKESFLASQVCSVDTGLHTLESLPLVRTTKPSLMITPSLCQRKVNYLSCYWGTLSWLTTSIKSAGQKFPFSLPLRWEFECLSLWAVLYFPGGRAVQWLHCSFSRAHICRFGWEDCARTYNKEYAYFSVHSLMLIVLKTCRIIKKDRPIDVGLS